MKISAVILISLGLASVGWAGGWEYLFTSTNTGTWVITISSGLEKTTLDEFVKSGRFCEIYGHRWHQWVDNYAFNCLGPDCHVHYTCEICKKERKKIKVNKEIEQWED